MVLAWAAHAEKALLDVQERQLRKDFVSQTQYDYLDVSRRECLRFSIRAEDHAWR